MTRIYDVLRAFGITRRFRGCRIAAEAVSIVLENEESLHAMTSEVYAVIAVKEQCTWYAVERNLRTVILYAWKKNRNLLIKMAGYPLEAPPTATEFIEILANFVKRLPPEKPQVEHVMMESTEALV